MAVMFPYSLLALLVTVCAASVVGGALLVLRKNWSERSLSAMVSVGGGVLLGLTLLDLLPHSIRHGGERVVPFVLVGFLFVFVIEWLSPKSDSLQISSALSVVAGFLMHAYVEGLSLIAALAAQPKLSLLGALILHRVPDAMTVASLLLSATGRRLHALAGASLLGAATFAGALSMGVAYRVADSTWSNATMAMASGVFLYVSASHLVPLSHRGGRAHTSHFFFLAVLVYLAISLVFRGAGHVHA